MNILLTLASSAVVAAVIAGIVTLRTTARNIKVEHVTKERAKWREKVRAKAIQVHRAAVNNEWGRVAELRLVFTLILNPFDQEDQAILNLIGTLETTELKEAALREFGDRVALLLKHDWERAKSEASSAIGRAFSLVERVPYECLRDERLRSQQRMGRE
jgi:hypothetical protein